MNVLESLNSGKMELLKELFLRFKRTYIYSNLLIIIINNYKVFVRKDVEFVKVHIFKIPNKHNSYTQLS